jgi:membrane protein involved in colicin uptake
MPQLAVSSEALPQALYQGEVCRTRMTLANKGALPLVNLQLVMASGSAVCAASNERLTAAAGACLLGRGLWRC